MVNDSISSLRTKSSNAADTSNAAKGNEAESSVDFGSILGKASSDSPSPSKVSKQKASESKHVFANKIDKPKVGSRDPFFPATPVPYHPDASAQAVREPARETSSAPVLNSSHKKEAIESLPTDEVREKQDVGISRAQLDHRAPSSGVTRSPADQPVLGRSGVASASVAGASDDTDDEGGAMNESYDGAAVSYPVSRIAKDSLDDETKEDLQAQGLWNLPTMVMAQPSTKLASMGAFTNGPSEVKMRESSVPVQKPIAQFMASLENDLGVSPDRLVQAFQKLSPGQMALPPEQTMIQVVKNLDLSKDEELGAMQAYSKMLAQMQMLDKPERLQAAPLVMGGFTTAKIEQQFESAALVKPEAKSVAGKYAVQVNDGMLKANGMQTMQAAKQAQGFDVANSDGLKGYGSMVNGQESKLNGLKGSSLNSEGVLQDTSSSFGNQIGMKNLEVKGQAQNYFDGQGQSANSGFAGNPGDQNLSSQNGAQNGALAGAAAMANGNAKEQVSFDSKREVSGKESGKESSVRSVGDTVNMNSSVVNSGSQNLQDLKSLQNVGAPASAAGATGAAAELKTESQARHEAIQHIVNNAQLLAQKGGGEMKLTLKPDHMGEIQLRVAMEGNKVNVQMTAEKSEVKKLIEQSIHELRSGLAQHNLSMEKIDVSVAHKDAGNQFQGKQPDFGAAQDFFNQFHQQQGSRHQMMTAMADLRSSVGRTPGSTNSGFNPSSLPSSASRPMGSSRLNVVA